MNCHYDSGAVCCRFLRAVSYREMRFSVCLLVLDGWTGAKRKSENSDQPVKKKNMIVCITVVVFSDCDC